MIKVGQFLSSRVDVMPPEITDELKGLQDEVPPEPFSDIRRVAESGFGVTLEEKFAEFEKKPLAAASLGQVHRARLHPEDQSFPLPTNKDKNGGFDVVVKVQRPNIEKIIETDLSALSTVGQWLHRYRPIRKRIEVPALLEEFSKTLYEEIDYLAEGQNAETFNENFKDTPGVRVPHVVWTHTTSCALTLENVWAIKITDYELITKAGISLEEVADRLLDVYLKQIFEDGFFHADPHPGNLFIHPLPYRSTAGSPSARQWELTFVDFGMVGQVPTDLRHGLREMLIGVGTQSAERVVASFKMMELLLPSADEELLERAITREFELFWGKDMSELNAISFDEMREFADEFRDLLYDMPFQVPQNAIFLARCVGILSGMCTGLNPRFNLWDHLAPYAQKIMAEEVSTGYEVYLKEIEKIVRTLVVMPYRVDRALTKIERGQLVVRNPEMSRQIRGLEVAIRKVAGGITFAALLLGGIQFYLGGQENFGIGLLIASGLNLLWLLFSGRKNNNR